MNGNMHMQKNMQVGTCRPFSKTEGIRLCNLYSLFPKAVLNSLEPFSKGKLKIMAQMSKAPAFSKAVAFSKAEWCSFFPKAAFFQRHIAHSSSSWVLRSSSGLVSLKCSSTLYLGATFKLSLVLETPMLMLCVSFEIWPTKSSPLKHHCILGFRYLEFHSKWMNVWCFATMWKLHLSFSKDQWCRKRYASRKAFPKARDSSYSAAVRIVLAPSHRLTSFSKLSAAQSICSCTFPKASSFSKDSMSLRTGSRAGSRCLASAPLQSRDAFFAQGFLGSVNMDSLRFVSLEAIPCLLYSPCTCWNMRASLSQGFFCVVLPGPSNQQR